MSDGWAEDELAKAEKSREIAEDRCRHESRKYSVKECYAAQRNHVGNGLVMTSIRCSQCDKDLTDG